jgi:hypothetical protein
MTPSKNVLLQTTTRMILPFFSRSSHLWCNIGISPLWTQLNGHKTLITDQQYECYSFLTLQDNFTSKDLILNNETYTSIALQDNFFIKETFLLCKIISHQ